MRSVRAWAVDLFIELLLYQLMICQQIWRTDLPCHMPEKIVELSPGTELIDFIRMRPQVKRTPMVAGMVEQRIGARYPPHVLQGQAQAGRASTPISGRGKVAPVDRLRVRIEL